MEYADDDDAIIDLIGEAWRVLSNPSDSEGRGNIISDEVGYFDDDWSKMARRVIRDFAETSQRPARWPWTDHRFDSFTWKV